MANWSSGLSNWLASLDAVFTFLLALPFLVALAGLIALFFERQDIRRAQSPKRSRFFNSENKKPVDWH